MLGTMRKHATSWLIKVACFAIVIVFIFWGGYSYTEKKANRVAVVNGSYIGLREYQSMYSNLVEQMRRQFGRQFSSELVETLNLKGQALDRLINRRLILAEAGMLKFDVSREELQNAIVSYPAFQTNDQFDPLRYQQILRSNRLTPQDFEANQREDLLINKVEQFITRGAKVLESEMLSFFHHTRDRVNLAYVQIDPQDFKNQVNVDEEAVRDYFDKHRENYRLADKRNILYVRFVPRDYLAEVEVTDQEIEEFYQLHQDNYREPKKVHARHILFRISEKAKTAEIQEILDRAKKVLNLARKGDNFAELARKYSEDSTAAKGGDLGYFKSGDMVKPFADSAFSLKKGEISDLVRTRFGIHIIKVEDIKEESVKPLAAVKETVRQSLKEERGREIALQRADSFIDLSRALDDLQKAAAEAGLEVKESGLFAAEKPIPQLGRHPEINEIIFALRPREISPAFSIGDDQLVAQLVEIQDSRLEEFAEAQERVQEDWITEQSEVLARKQAQEWLETARQEGNLAEVARRNKLKINKTGLFTTISPAPPFGNQRDMVITAFSLTPEQPVPSEVYEVDGKFIILQLEDSQPASENGFQKEKDSLAKQLLQAKKEQTFSRWINGRRQQADIEML
ncbi:MAG: SurA N-terminal domain-containing protein, partial [Deltaproteobacteria bacterium]|nr:SurA N-terminal domain-containing protein [Deltaproteobacteria bacterium]